MRELRLFLLTAALLVAGCYAPPRSVSEADDTGFRLTEALMITRNYWKRHGMPALQGKVKRVAILEFGVQFVTGRWIKPFPGAAVVDPTQYSQSGLAQTALGLGRRITSYEDELFETLPIEMYELFVKDLQEHGLEVIPREQVTAAKAYTQLELEEHDDASLLHYVNPFGTDLGRLRNMETHPPEGLLLIDGVKGDADVEDVSAALLEELDADVVIRAKFRVGVHHKQASIESGSVLEVTGKGVLGSLESHRSLLSDESVKEGGIFLPIRGKRTVVNSDAYHASMRVLLPKYLELGRRDLRAQLEDERDE